MMLVIVCKGLLIGLLIALPVGPAGALAVRRALVDGPRAGFLSGLGASVADICYLILLEVGMATVSFSAGQTRLMRGVGGVMVIALGLPMLLRDAAARPPLAERRGRPNAFLSAFLLSIINPTILLSLAVLVAGFELEAAGRRRHNSVLLIASVFAGSVLLWLLLSRAVRSIGQAPAVRKLAGAAFVALGLIISLLAIARIDGPA